MGKGRLFVWFAVMTMGVFPGCMSAYKKSVGADEGKQVFSRIYFTDLQTSWQATLEAIKNLPLDISNREFGFLQTKWKENTAERNFLDASGAARSYLKAQYRFKISMTAGLYDARPSIKLTVQKEQMIQRDPLEGWIPIPTDEIEENTLLYRIGRIIVIRTKMQKMGDQRASQGAVPPTQ